MCDRGILRSLAGHHHVPAGLHGLPNAAERCGFDWLWPFCDGAASVNDGSFRSSHQPAARQAHRGYAAAALGRAVLHLRPAHSLSGASVLLPQRGNFAFSTRDSHSGLAAAIQLVRGVRRPNTDFFLRAESLFTAATYLEELASQPAGNPLAAYGGISLHEQSHGESFLMINRFGAEGFYLLDEPEAALSTQNCLTCLRRIHGLVRQGSQFIIATHSPIILAYRNAMIYTCGHSGLEEVAYDDTDLVCLTRSFLDAPERFLHQLLTD